MPIAQRPVSSKRTDDATPPKSHASGRSNHRAAHESSDCRAFGCSNVFTASAPFAEARPHRSVRAIAENRQMKLGRLNHVGVATPSIADSVAFWRESWARQRARALRHARTGREGVLRRYAQLPDRTDRAARRQQPDRGFLEEPEGRAASPVLRGSGHRRRAADFEEAGKRILGETRIGAHGTPIFFVHPKDMGGVLTEIMETPRGS